MKSSEVIIRQRRYWVLTATQDISTRDNSVVINIRTVSPPGNAVTTPVNAEERLSEAKWTKGESE